MSNGCINPLSIASVNVLLGHSHVFRTFGECDWDGPRTSGLPFVTGFDDAREADAVVLRWNSVIRFCTVDSMVRCRTRVCTMASLLSSILAGSSRELQFNLLAGCTGGEAKVGGEECECGWSAMARTTK